MERMRLELPAEGAARVISVCRSVAISGELLAALFGRSRADAATLISAWRTINHSLRCPRPRSGCDGPETHSASLEQMNEGGLLRFVSEHGVTFDVERRPRYDEPGDYLYQIDIRFGRYSRVLAARMLRAAARAVGRPRRRRRSRCARCGCCS